jgi:hypothetical protein
MKQKHLDWNENESERMEGDELEEKRMMDTMETFYKVIRLMSEKIIQ